MAYYNYKELLLLGFKKLGRNVKISKKASIYNHNQIEISDNSRIDDFCVVSGKVLIGRNCHITPSCIIAGGEKGVFLHDFTTLAYGVKVFSQSDDYSGKTMTNSTVPSKYKFEFKKEVIIKRHSIVGTGSIIMPGVTLEEGTSVGAASLVLISTEPWGIYAGSPAKRIKNRSKDLLRLEDEYLKIKNFIKNEL